ncbi:MAG: GNAT family N-acetyltransferase [Sporichthyaceae bacterium]
MPDVPTLRTERLLLRGWRASDRVPFATLNANPQVLEFMPYGPLSGAASDAWIERIEAHWAEHGYGLFAVEVVGGSEFIGYVGLANSRFEAPFTPAVEVGWRLTRSAWGHGYATEAALAAVRFGYQVAGLPEIMSWTAATNLRSRAVMERIGLRHDAAGDFEHPGVEAGHVLRPHVLYRFPAGREWGAS